MFDLINGLPVHPLVVHAVVVLLPLTVLGTIAAAIRADWRQRYGWLLVGVAATATALIPIATASGESLERRLGDPGQHAQLGDQLIWFALPLLLLDVAMVYLSHRQTRDHRARPSRSLLIRGVAVLAILAGLATGVQVYRVGDSGARAAWGDQIVAK